jgi:F0F1-type ATP synthase membrane subunit b/b'
MSEALQSAVLELVAAAAVLTTDNDTANSAQDDAFLVEFRETTGELATNSARLGEISRFVRSAQGATPSPASFYLSAATSEMIAHFPRQAMEISARFQRFNGTLEQHASEFGEQVEALRSDFDTAMESANTLTDTLDAELEESRSVIESLVQDAIEDYAAKLEERRQALREVIEEKLLAAPVEFAQDVERALTDSLEGAQEIFSIAAENLRTKVTTVVKELMIDARSEARQTIEQKVRKIIEQVLSDLANDVVENAALSQVSVSLTATLSPVLPQLIAAKVVLGEIRSLLEAMRLGL